MTSLKGRIVGVVGDTIDERAGIPNDPQVFFPASRGPVRVLLVRTDAERDNALVAAQTVVRNVWPGQTELRLVRLEDEISRGVSDYRGRALLLTALAVAGMCLALLGLAGSLTYTIQQQTRETAIRLALGASPLSIGARVVGSALMAGSIGLLCGVAAGIVSGRWASSLWFGVAPFDPAALLAVSTVMAVAVLSAASCRPCGRRGSTLSWLFGRNR